VRGGAVASRSCSERPYGCVHARPLQTVRPVWQHARTHAHPHMRAPGYTQGILNHVPECYPGLLLRSELQYLHTVCNSPVRCGWSACAAFIHVSAAAAAAAAAAMHRVAAQRQSAAPDPLWPACCILLPIPQPPAALMYTGLLASSLAAPR
jgi:hypothetical protein